MPIRSSNTNNYINGFDPDASIIDLECPDENESNSNIATNSRMNTQFSNVLPDILMNQHAEQQRAMHQNRNIYLSTYQQNRQRLTQQTLDFNNPNNLSNTIYSNPNIHIHELSSTNNNAPIIISDNEDDPATFSDTATAGSTDTSNLRRLFRRPNSSNYYSDNESYNTQVFANIEDQLDNNSTIILDDGDNAINNNNNNNNNNSIPDDVVDDDDDDDIQIVSARETPDIEVVSSQNAGFRLYTPSGPLFVPATEVNHGGNGMSRFISNVNNNIRNRTTRQSRPSYMRPDVSSRAQQDQLRRRQLSANRRARLAANSSNSSNYSNGSNSSHVRSQNNSIINDSELSLLNLLQQLTGTRYSPFISNITDNFVRSADPGEVPEEIMRILRQRDDAREDERIRSRIKIATSEKIQKAELAKIEDSMRDKFSNTLGSKTEVDVCILCGIDLIQGIPKDYSNQDDNKKRLTNLLNDGFIAPWNGIKRFNTLDLDLSKKVFFSSCGHIYCGRCVNNIMRFRSMTGKERRLIKAKYKDSTQFNEFENPELCSPLKCIANGCSKKFTGKTPFIEMYV